MKALIVADIHIKLGQRKVPKEWQTNRVKLLAKEINKQNPEIVVIAGDLFDTAKPTIEEVGLTLEFLGTIEAPSIIIPGNHEMVTKKKDCFHPLEYILQHLDVKIVRDFDSHTLPNVDLIPYGCINSEIPRTDNALAITHVRGSIPPHVEPEVDLDKFSHYDKVFAGDLHSYTNSQLNILYPGSPFATSFHRKPNNKGTTGMFMVDLSTGAHEWVQLDLPELLRYTVESADDMVGSDVDHIIYELSGSLEDLALVNDSDLLDKKVTNNVFLEAQLDLENTEITDEIATFLAKIKNLDDTTISRVLERYRSLT